VFFKVMITNRPLVLASNSPRRQQIMREAGFDFVVKVRPTDEVFPENMPPVEVPTYLATKKAEQFLSDLQNEIILCADTIVVVDDEILNKPANEIEAKAMLKKLSGRSHQAITGICVLTKEKMQVATDVAQVFFKELTDNEIDYYIKNYRPFDKAGAYGIQEWISMIGIERIEGSYYTIMGLPIHLVYRLLRYDF
jgi:septum formation protein